MDTKKTISFIRKTLTEMQLEFEEDYEFSTVDESGHYTERVFAFKVGNDEMPLYIDYYPRDSLDWYDERDYIAKDMINSSMTAFSLKTGTEILLVTEGEDVKVIKELLKEKLLEYMQRRVDKVIEKVEKEMEDDNV